ncbi:MAG: CvpA family protein [Dysgonamonadaceae bacterium]|jgi:membrane protein required for colicin V production|nr:CvpA family protein [Dysgonamonadaceae bacterium]
MNWLDVIIVICLVIGIIKGLFDGIIKQLISVIALILAVVLSGSVATWLRKLTYMYFPAENSFSAGTISAIYYVAAFIIIIILFALVAKFVDKIINYTPAEIFNRLLGALFGAFMWMLCLSIFLNIVAVFDSNNALIYKQTTEKSIYYNRVKKILPSVYPYIKEFFKNA